jgi:hypothetical protein
MWRAMPIVAVAGTFLFLRRTERRRRNELRAIAPPGFELVDRDFAHGLFGLSRPLRTLCLPRPGHERRGRCSANVRVSTRGYEVTQAPYVDAIEVRGQKPGVMVHARVGWRGVGPHLVPVPISEGYVAASVTVGDRESS